MARLSTSRLGLACAVVAAATTVGLSPGPAGAGLVGGLLGSNCPTSGTQVFAPWSDPSYYYPASNGGLEQGATGWTLSGGASVVAGNEPFLSSGTHSLSLPSGSSATSPLLCLGPKDVALRMFASDLGGKDSGLHVRVLWYGLLNTLLGSSDYAVLAPGSGWAPSATVPSSGGLNVLLPLVGSTSARVQIWPTGAGSRWLVDDLYVDPWLSH